MNRVYGSGRKTRCRFRNRGSEVFPVSGEREQQNILSSLYVLEVSPSGNAGYYSRGFFYY